MIRPFQWCLAFIVLKKVDAIAASAFAHIEGIRTRQS